jgi:tol-pal system protein YbgF
VIGRPLSRAAGLLAVGLAGGAACASPGEVNRVQNDVAVLRAETARQDSVQSARLAEVIRSQQRLMDSLESTRLALRNLRGATQQDFYKVEQQLVQLQELTGQSQRRLSEMRTQLEAREAQISGGGGALSDTTAPPDAAATASADQIYEASVAQLRRGSTATARTGLRQLLQNHPTSERVPDALYFMGQSFAAENQDSAAAYYNLVVRNHAQSPRAPAALYNLGLLAERRKDTAAARDAYQRVLQRYPRSDEAALARDRLRSLGR